MYKNKTCDESSVEYVEGGEEFIREEDVQGEEGGPDVLRRIFERIGEGSPGLIVELIGPVFFWPLSGGEILDEGGEEGP